MNLQTSSLAVILLGALPTLAFAGDKGEPPLEPLLTDLGCSEFNRFETLTPNDTLTLIVNVHNAEHAQGFLVVAAADEVGEHIGFDALIGQTMVINGLDRFEYSVNPLDYRAAVSKGAATDLNGDGYRDLDGNEYERTAAELLIPRFIGATQQANGSRLILIGLAGGGDFDTTVDFLIYNDNEEVFSGEHTFNCWDKVPLTTISNAFRSSFLSTTDHDLQENAAGRENGWFRMEGAVANSVSTSIAHPPIAAVYIERVGQYSVADLPFEIGLADGSLLPRGPMGGGLAAVPTAIDPDARIARRQPGSLLLYPEFDSRGGVLTLVTVTNTDPADEVRAHFVYYGKFAGGM